MGKLENQKSKKRELAAQMIADDELSNREIAEQLGVVERTIERWCKNQEFKERVAEIAKAYADRVLNKGIARKEKRLEILKNLQSKLEQVISERAADPELASIPGGKTGLVTKQLKGIGKGGDFQVVEVYEVDTATLKEIRAILEQVAEGVGQKVTKHEHTGPDGDPIAVRVKLEQLLAG